MKNIIVAPVGENIDALFVGIREFPTEKVILLCSEDKTEQAEKAKNDLDRFRIPVIIKIIKGNIWEEMFRVIGEIKKQEGDKNLIINTSTGDDDIRCAVTSAAFVNGLKAFGVTNDKIMLLPILKFSYYKLLTNKKMFILRILHENEDCCASLEELSKRTKMSLPLISYHINGTLKSDGLKQLGLVDIAERKGKMNIKLSILGKLLIKGYV